MAVRTRFFDVFFADATTAGIRQGVILRSTRVAYSANGFELPDDDMMTALAGDSGYLSAVLN